MITPHQLAKSGTEHGEQMAVMCWTNLADQKLRFPELRWLYAIPNAGARGNHVAASHLKAEGVKAGVSDLCLPVRNAYASGLYIEMKRADGKMNDVSSDQKEFGRFVISQGFEWRVAFGWIEAVNIIQAYLLPDAAKR